MRTICLLVLAAGIGCTCSSAAPSAPQDGAPGKTEAAESEAQDIAPTGVQEPLKSPTELAPGCTHPAVFDSCADGWCLIPAGCFLQGSPESEPERAMYGERLTAVTLTRSFVIQQHEVTQGEWARFAGGKTGIVGDPAVMAPLCDCLEDDCPADAVNLMEAMAYANFLSLNNDPPLPPCFSLLECNGPSTSVLQYPFDAKMDDSHMTCADFSLNAPSIHECQGFRLPTESEWEYAARAGSQTPYYSGELMVNPDPLQRTTYEDLNLSPIAWYNWNSANQTHPVMRKMPNAWGLYDVLGNIWELTYSRRVMDDFAGPVVDPSRPPSTSSSVVAKGGLANGYPALLRAANRFPIEPNGLGAGLRLVRTLWPGEVWPSVTPKGQAAR